MARTQQPSGHRDRLLAAAHTCLQEKGYAATTARDLATVSGTNLASIGYHFGGKEALLTEALTECFDAWADRVETAVFDTEPASPRDALERALVALIDGFEELRPLLISCVEGHAPALRSTVLREKLAQGFTQARRRGADMIQRACHELGVQLTFPPEAFVSVLIAIVDGLALQWLTDPDSIPDAHQLMEVLTALSLIAG